MSIDGAHTHAMDSEVPAWNVDEAFEGLCSTLLERKRGNQQIWSRNDYKNGGRNHQLINDPDDNRTLAIEITMTLSSREIAHLLAHCTEQFLISGKDLQTYRSRAQRMIRALRSMYYRFFAPYNGWSEIQLMMADINEQEIQLRPQVIYRVLEILDQAEAMLKEWPEYKKSPIST